MSAASGSASPPPARTRRRSASPARRPSSCSARVAPISALEAGAIGTARTQLGACANYLPGYPDRCSIVTDPRGAGVALGAIDQ